MPDQYQTAAALLNNGTDPDYPASPYVLQGAGDVLKAAGQSLYNRYVDPAIQAFTLPGRAMRGEVLPDQSIPESLNFAQALMGAGMPNAEEGAAGIFGGQLAKTANPLQLAKAKFAKDLGGSAEDVFNDTGWFQGRDGKWRFEIPDKDAKAQIPSRPPDSLEKPPMGELLDHPALYENYPDIKDVPVLLAGEPGNAMHSPHQNLESFTFSPWDALTDPKKTLTPTALHEAQHAVQWRERFAPGGNPTQMTQKVVDNLENRGLIKRVGSDKFVTTDPDMRLQNLVNNTGHEAYQRLAGEVEARNVANRYQLGNMPQFKNRVFYPWETEDRPSNVQIVHPPNRNSPYDKPVDPKDWVVKALNK